MSQSGGTAIATSNADISFSTVDLNPADNASGRTVYSGSYLLVKVNHGNKQLVTSDEYTNLVNAGYDVEILKER
jgi:hypothetical protein